jgi:invasion protein IalB
MKTPALVAYAIGLFILGAAAGVGGDRLATHKDIRDGMTTIDTVQDWRMTCPPRTSKKGFCVLQQMIYQKGTNNVIAELNVVPKDKVDQLTVVTPLGVLVTPGLRVSIGSAVTKPLQFKTCVQVGCIATTPIDSSMASALAQNTSGQILLVAGNGKTVALNYSLRGYKDAMAARATDMAARDQ